MTLNDLKFSAEEERAKRANSLAERDAELARRLALEEEYDLLPTMGDADLALEISEREKEKRRRQKQKELEDRKYAERNG